MEDNVFLTMMNWLVGLVLEFGKFGNWLITPIDYIGISPLALISVSGITIIVALLAMRLIVGG